MQEQNNVVHYLCGGLGALPSSILEGFPTCESAVLYNCVFALLFVIFVKRLSLASSKKATAGRSVEGAAMPLEHTPLGETMYDQKTN